jgi:hypothetical protein
VTAALLRARLLEASEASMRERGASVARSMAGETGVATAVASIEARVTRPCGV